MKTRMLAMACVSGRDGSRRAQALGFVSMMTVKREGAGSGVVSYPVGDASWVVPFAAVS